jgi:hypothetical protein
VYTVLRAALDDATINGLIADNPAAKMPRRRVAREEARHPTEFQYRCDADPPHPAEWPNAIELLADSRVYVMVQNPQRIWPAKSRQRAWVPEPSEVTRNSCSGRPVAP